MGRGSSSARLAQPGAAPTPALPRGGGGTTIAPQSSNGSRLLIGAFRWACYPLRFSEPLCLPLRGRVSAKRTGGVEIMERWSLKGGHPTPALPLKGRESEGDAVHKTATPKALKLSV